MRIIDFHTHAFPDALAERAIAALSEGAKWQAETDGTIAGLLEKMDANGVEKSVIANIATKPEQAPKILGWSKQIASDRIVPFASVHPDSPTLRQQIDAIADAGLKGIKLHPLYQDFLVDDEKRAFPIYDAAAARNLLILFHAGYDIAFGDEDHASPHRFARVLDAFDSTKMVLSHFGAWRDYDQTLEHLAGRDVYLETSFSTGYCTDAQRDALLKAHPADRILFGSDSPWGGMRKQIAFVQDFPLDEAQKELILYKNAATLLDR